VGTSAVGPTLEEIQRFAVAGLPEAQVTLGNLYANGDGVPQDHAEAARWYRLAADQGLAGAQHNLGLAYANGNGVPQNYAEAVKWYRLGAYQGNEYAQSNLGFMYATGAGVAINYVTAYAWFNVAAAFGHEEAFINRSAAEFRMTPAQIAEGQQLSTEIFERIQQGNE
jgi:hypothetical protein